MKVFPFISILISPILGYVGYKVEMHGQSSYMLMVSLCILSALIYLMQGTKNVLILSMLFLYLLLLRIIFSVFVGGNLENLNGYQSALLVLLALIPFVAALLYIFPSIINKVNNKF